MNNLFKRLACCGLALIALAPLASAELVIPESPGTYVLDEAGVFSEAVLVELESELSAFDQETSIQVVVVTLSDLQGYPIEEVSLKIGRDWGVGQEEFDNGVVFLIAPNERETRIEVGRGLEGAIPDATAWLILDEAVIPHFANSDYGTGALEGTYYILNLAKDENFDLSALESNESAFAEFIGSFGIFFGWFLFSFMSQSKSWWAGGIFGGIIALIFFPSIPYLIAGVLIGLLLDFIASTLLYKQLGSGCFFGSGSSGGSSGGFSGGGGGFGGGGASGRW